MADAPRPWAAPQLIFALHQVLGDDPTVLWVPRLKSAVAGDVLNEPVHPRSPNLRAEVAKRGDAHSAK
ncbi:hypothetical protein OG604_03665 [Streptomyces sp. NBC_01231]|nr:hypothetical protein OG604_03665 [Streptomyces sp. NBC_01231]